MNSKERVKKALAFEEADRVPIGDTVDYKIIEEVLGRPTFYRAAWKMQNALWQGRRNEVVEDIKHTYVDFVQALEFDVVTPCWCPSADLHELEIPEFLDKYTWRDPKTGSIMRYDPVTEDMGVVKVGEKVKQISIDELIEQEEKSLEHFKIDESTLEVIKYCVDYLGKDHFILGGAYFHAYINMLGDMEKTMIAMLCEKKKMRRLIELRREKAAIHLDAVMATGVDGIFFGSDWGDKRGSIISPELYKELVYPGQRKLYSRARKAGKYVFMHSCGNNSKLLDMWIDAGMQCYQSIDRTAGESITQYKKIFGKKLAYWGNVDSGWTLTYGTTNDVRKETEELLRDAAPGGGLILGSSHSIHRKVKYENYMMMLDTARKKGQYPIMI